MKARALTSPSPDFPVIDDPLHPAIEDPEDELEAERQAEDADTGNVGRLSRLAYVKKQVNRIKAQLPINNHGDIPLVYRHKSLWIRRPDRCFLLNTRADPLPSMSELLLPDILLILPCILLRLASPDSRLSCPKEGCDGRATRSGEFAVHVRYLRSQIGQGGPTSRLGTSVVSLPIW